MFFSERSYFFSEKHSFSRKSFSSEKISYGILFSDKFFFKLFSYSDVSDRERK